ncbi:hypothetical protein MMC28_001170 [Mycoblastus sanguinarius]|nr:hypothetical protein [Mycoblastus sanguinarius]
MPPPSPLAIATSSVSRLLKEESSYRTELSTQEQRIAQLQTGAGAGAGTEEEDGVGNSEFWLRQEDSGGNADPKEVEAAREAVMKAKGGQ